MDVESGDDYIRRTASFIRANESKFAQSGLLFVRRGRGKTASLPSNNLVSSLNPLWWVGLAEATGSPKGTVLSLDVHHLFYLLMRLEEMGLDIGSLDISVDNPSRPMSYLHIPDVSNDKSETLSISSFRSSLSVVSKLSLGGSWWNAPPPSVDVDLKYIYSSFTKLPALSLHAPGPKTVKELLDDPPGDNATPLDSFKNLQSLELVDIDPRTLLGWDRLAESLRSLTITRSGIEDPTCIFLDAVLEDQARREGHSRSRVRRIGQRSLQLPETVSEEEEEEHGQASEATITTPSFTKLSPLKWAFIKHLSLVDNVLTSLPSNTFNSLTSLTHLDLSSNLFVSVPPCLSALFNLTYLNLSNNMIDSVLGIYSKLGQILTLNLSRNRLESLCGLERLYALEKVDLRHNNIEESAEVGRLATLPNVAEVWVADNPLVQLEDGYRVKCFEWFRKEGKDAVLLDGSLPGFYERMQLSPVTVEERPTSRPPSAAFAATYVLGSGSGGEGTRSRSGSLMGSPMVRPSSAGTGASPGLPATPSVKSSNSNSGSPSLGPTTTPSTHGVRPRKRPMKRFVDLDGGDGSEDSGKRVHGHAFRHSHSRSMSFDNGTPNRRRGNGEYASPSRAFVVKQGAVPEDDDETPVKSKSNDRGDKELANGSKLAKDSSEAPDSETTPKGPLRTLPLSSLPDANVEGGRSSAANDTLASKRPRHSRSRTEHVPASPPPPFSSSPSQRYRYQVPSSPPKTDIRASSPSPSQSSTPPRINFARLSSTISAGSGSRRGKLTASLYDPVFDLGVGGSPSKSHLGVNGNGDDGRYEISPLRDADAMRARIEALRNEVGESWLHVLNQSQMGTGVYKS